MGIERLNAFTRVDEAVDPAGYVDLMDRVGGVPTIQVCRRLAVAAMHLRPGDRILDVGCGNGDATVDLARRVAPDGEAVGIDLSVVMIEEAVRRWEGAELPVHFKEGDAQRLPFPDGTFDACRTERMLCHVPDARAALTEMVRVTRQGGWIAAIDVDLEAALLDSADVGFTRLFVRSLADSLSHGRLGRQLHRLFHLSGLSDVKVALQLAHTEFDLVRQVFHSHLESLWMAGKVDVTKANEWWTDLEERDASGTFFLAAPTVVIAGRKR